MTTIRRYKKAKRQPCFLLDYTDTSTGKRHRKYLYCSRKEATEIKRKVDADLTLKKYGIKKDNPETRQKLTSLLNNFITYKKNGNIAPKTIKAYKNAVLLMVSAIGDVYPSALKKIDYDVILGYLKDRYNSNSINIHLRGMRTFINWLVESEIILSPPFKIKEIKLDSPLPRFIKPNDLKLIYDQCDDQKMLNHWQVLEHTGLRLGELYSSYADDGYIRILANPRAGSNKVRRERIIPVDKNTYKQYLEIKNDSYSASWVSHSFHNAGLKVGLGVRIHDLRHTFALKKLNETGDIFKVKMLLGHSSVVVTEKYLQFPPEYLKELFN